MNSKWGNMFFLFIIIILLILRKMFPFSNFLSFPLDIEKNGKCEF